MAFSLSGSYKKAQDKNKKYYTQLKKDQKKVINSIKKETSAAAKKAAKNNKKFQISKTYKKAQDSNKKYYAQLEKEHAKRRKAAKEAAKAAKKKPTKISNKYNSYRGAEGQKKLKKISAADKKAREKAREQAAAKKKAAATTIPVNSKNYTKKQLKAKSKAQKKAAATTIPVNGKNYTKEQLKKLKTKSNKQKLQDLYDRGQISKKELAGLGYTIKNGKVIKAKADYSIKGKDLSEKISGNNGNNGNGNGDSRYISKSKGKGKKGAKGSIKSTASKAAITAVLTGHGIGTKGKRRFDVRLLLYGANKLDGFSSKYQVDATTHLQKYIANLESYLNELGNVHQSASNISCFNASITILEKLNQDFNTLKTHVDTLSDKMRSIAKNMIKADGSKTYEQVNKEAKSLKINSKDFNAATASLISSLSTAEKKRLAKVIKKLKTLTSAEVSTKVVSKLKKTKAGKEFYKEYVKANTKTTKKSKSKVNTYKPAKYKSRAAWKKALISKYKKEKGLSDADAKKMATAQMKLREKLAKGKISKTQYKTQVNKKLSSIKAKANLKADESTVKTETVEQIKARNGDSTTSSPAKESTTTTENTSSSSSSSSSTSTTSSTTGNNTTTQTTTQQSSTTTQTSTGQSSTTTQSASSTGESAAAAATGTVAGAGAGAAVTHNPLPASNPQPQAASNFAENYSASEGASASATSAPESQVDESADTGASEEGIDFSDNLDGEASGTTDDLTGLENETDSETDSGVIDGLESDSSSSSSKKSSSGTSPVVPVVASVAAAGAAGVGAKIILDKRANSNNEGNFGTENWDESSGGDYGLSSGDVEYYDNGSSNKNDNLIDDDNTDSKYDYKAGSIDEVDVEEKEKKDAEEGIASFNDSIAYDAISDADINATH